MSSGNYRKPVQGFVRWFSRLIGTHEYTVLLATANGSTREQIEKVIEQHRNFRLVGVAEDGERAALMCRQTRAEMILLDIDVPKLNGVEAAATIVAQHPSCIVIILSRYDDEYSVASTILAGARAFVLANSPKDLIAAMSATVRGKSYLSPQVAARVLPRLKQAMTSSSFTSRDAQ
jgi:DNA-binding NarL/FixJ family response regulator